MKNILLCYLFSLIVKFCKLSKNMWKQSNHLKNDLWLKFQSATKRHLPLGSSISLSCSLTRDLQKDRTGQAETLPETSFTACLNTL